MHLWMVISWAGRPGDRHLGWGLMGGAHFLLNKMPNKAPKSLQTQRSEVAQPKRLQNSMALHTGKPKGLNSLWKLRSEHNKYTFLGKLLRFKSSKATQHSSLFKAHCFHGKISRFVNAQIDLKYFMQIFVSIHPLFLLPAARRHCSPKFTVNTLQLWWEAHKICRYPDLPFLIVTIKTGNAKIVLFNFN